MTDKPIILIVQNNREDFETIAKHLKNSNFNLVWAKTAEEVNGIIKQNIDCVVLDYELPYGESLDILALIRTKNEYTPVILTSKGASTPTEQRDDFLTVRLLKTGVVEFVPKAILTIESLSRAIDEALQVAADNRIFVQEIDRMIQINASLREKIKQYAVSNLQLRDLQKKMDDAKSQPLA